MKFRQCSIAGMKHMETDGKLFVAPDESGRQFNPISEFTVIVLSDIVDPADLLMFYLFAVVVPGRIFYHFGFVSYGSSQHSDHQKRRSCCSK